MSGRLAVIPYVIGMVVLIVAMDIVFFRQHAWARLLVNVGIVLVFAAFYLRFQAVFGGR